MVGKAVADKRRVQQSMKRWQRIYTWQLVVLLILAGFVAATFLRLNNIGMIERRDAVLSADEAGNDETTTTRLYDLQRYVSAHMNTDLGKGIYLESSYNRDKQALLDKASADNNPNGNIYKKAQDVCAPQFSRYSAAYVACTTSELAKYPAANDLSEAVKLSPDLYLHVFSSPLWSPDFAGWSVLVCIVLMLMILVRLISVIVLRIILHHHYKNA